MKNFIGGTVAAEEAADVSEPHAEGGGPRVSNANGTDVVAATICLNRALRVRDLITSLHVGRVGQLAARLAAEMGFDAGFCTEFGEATSLHDVGKLVVPLEIIQKPTALSQIEVMIIQTHSTYGHTILSGTGEPLLDFAAEIALYHHEKYDGGGYPDGIVGEDIPQTARMVSICDVYDAVRRDRPYRRGATHEEALKLIVNGDDRTATSSFDPQVLEAFLAMEVQVDEMYRDIHLEYGLVS